MKKLKITFEDSPGAKIKYKAYPRFDINVACFGTEEEIENKNVAYIKKIRAKVIRRICIPMAIILIAVMFVIGFFIGKNQTVDAAYKKVYVSESGNRYHLYDCTYIDESNIQGFTIDQAQSKGYEPCKKCKPDRLTK